MKIKFLFLYCNFIFLSCAFTQNKFEVEEVENYINLIDKIKINPNKIKNLSNEEVNNIACIMYNAFKNEPLVQIEINGKNKQWEENVKKNREYINVPRPGSIQGNLFEVIEKRLSKWYTYLIQIPIFIKGKIINANTFKYNDPYSEFRFVKTEVKVTIEEILKAPASYKVDDTLTFYYMNNWINQEFIIEENYFIPLEFRSENNLDFDLALVTYINKDKSIYKIDDNTFFDLEKNISWDQFKIEFYEKIEEIKN